MVNDMLFQIAVEHGLRNLDAGDMRNLETLKTNTIQLYAQLQEVYQELKDHLKDGRKQSDGEVMTF